MGWKEFFKPSVVSIIIFIVLIIILAVIPMNIYPCTSYVWGTQGVDYSSGRNILCSVPFLSAYIGPHIEYSWSSYVILILVNIILPYVLSRIIVYPFHRKKK